MSDAVLRVLAPRGGPASYLAAAVRVVTGVLFVMFGVGKLVDHAQEALDFDRYGVPLPDVAVYVSGAVEVLGGLLLIVGLLTRVAAFFLVWAGGGVYSLDGRIEGRHRITVAT